MAEVIRARNLQRRFGSLLAVDGLTFNVQQGEVFALLGPNGSGKTTTIRMLCGILAPSGGQGQVLGYDIAVEGERIKSSIGYMSQRFALYEDLSVQENLEFYGGIYSVPRTRLRQRVTELVGMAGLEGREHQLAGTLSGGWKQRLALGCAIVHEPPLLFLDEPTAGVDPISRRRFWRMIYGLAQSGVTVFLTTHYLDEAEHAHRVAMMFNGRLMALDTPEGVKRAAISGRLMELECSPVMEALAILEETPGVLETALYGLVFHVHLDLGLSPEALRNHLEVAGLHVGSLRPIAPTLEDAFISMLSRTNQGEGGTSAPWPQA